MLVTPNHPALMRRFTQIRFVSHGTVIAWLMMVVVGAIPSVDAQSPTDFLGELTTRGTTIRSWDDLDRFAAEIAKQPYAPEEPLSPELASLDYERYREIQFRHQAGTWDDGRHPFWLEYFHRGFVQQDRVEVFAIELDGKKQTNAPEVRRIAYDPRQFRYGDDPLPWKLDPRIGFAGLKIAGRFTSGGDPQELLTFLGSSYFRSRSADTVYGSSARGLAIDIGLNRDEEFPDFRAFWVIEPKSKDRQIRVLGLLDGPSVVGAYAFDFDAGETVSRVGVMANLYFRKVPEKLAIAPLTSMWCWGDGLPGPPRDNRPSVHDADGLLVHDDEGWRFRALARLPYPSISSTPIKRLEGFGLVQRDRRFEHYRDTGARYHERPSVWIAPNEPWTSGRIELLEIPGAHEGIDNIGAYFVPDARPSLDQPTRLDYTVVFTSTPPETLGAIDAETRKPVPRRLAWCEEFDVDRIGREIHLKIRFAAPDTKLQSVVGPSLRIQTVRGEVRQSRVDWARVDWASDGGASDGGIVATVVLVPTEDTPIEIGCELIDDRGEPLSEIFAYLCPLETPAFVYPAVYTRQE